MLATKNPEEQQMLVQAALHEARGSVGASGCEVGVSGRGIRRSISATEMRKSSAIAQITARYGPQARAIPGILTSSLRGSACSIDARPHSAECVGWPQTQQLRVPKQKKASLLSTSQVRAQILLQLSQRWAATTLQSHWRGWQHRRFARFMRARRKRHVRLSWLWDLDSVCRLLVAHRACTCIQAAWRASSVARKKYSAGLVNATNASGLQHLDIATAHGTPSVNSLDAIQHLWRPTEAADPQKNISWKADVAEVRDSLGP